MPDVEGLSQSEADTLADTTLDRVAVKIAKKLFENSK